MGRVTHFLCSKCNKCSKCYLPHFAAEFLTQKRYFCIRV